MKLFTSTFSKLGIVGPGELKLRLLMLLVLGVFGSSEAFAATFTVVNTNDSGPGSLRQAIMDANVNLQDDTIVFDASVFNTPQVIVLTTGNLEVLPDALDGTYRALTINGPGANLLTLDGNHHSRIFHLRDLVTVALDGVRMINGNGTPNNETNVLGSGGAIRNEGPLTLTNSIIDGNDALLNSGFGGGIGNFGTVTAINCAIINNTAAGGGAFASYGPAVFINSTISHNSATIFGGAMRIDNNAANLINSTVAFNDAPSTGGISVPYSQFTNSRLLLTNSIVARNSSAELFGRDINGQFQSSRSSIVGVMEGANLSMDLGGNLFNVNPRLDPELKQNGGIIPTNAPAADSPAIDHGDNCVLTSGSCSVLSVTVDARGTVRPQDGDGDGTATVDMGSFEVTRTEVLAALAVAPDLHASSDTGVSDTDNITSSSNLVFDIGGLTPGLTVELLRDGVAVASAAATGTTITLADTSVSQNGPYVYAARQITEAAVNLHGPGTLVIFDTVAPTVTVNQSATQTDPTRVLPIVFEVVFSEPVANFDAADLSLAGSSAGVGSATIVISGAGPAYSVTVGNVNADGTVVASIPAAAVTDAAGNSTSASTSTDNIVTLDTTAPTVTINQSATQVDPARQLPINFTVVFSEPVTGFTSSDVSLTGSTVNVSSAVKTVTGSGSTYNVAVSNLSSSGGTVVASITSQAAQDLAGNISAASTSTDNTVFLDNVAPTVTINQSPGQPDPANSGPINFTVVFSEVVTGFNAADLQYFNSTVPTTQLTATILGSGTTYSVAIDNLPLTNGGILRVAVRAGGATDAVGNSNLASSSVDNTVLIDNIAPGVTINQSIGQPDPSSTQPIRFTVVFNETVIGFSAAGISLAGSTANVASANIQVSGSGSVYTVLISNVTSSGQVRASVLPGAAQDQAANPNTLSTSTDNVITVTVMNRSHFDYDGDGRSDISVFRPSTGAWYLQRSTAGYFGVGFGAAEDRIVPADYDGDGKTDIAVYRPSTGIWYVTNSSTGAVTYIVFGIAEDLPTPADYDGDGKADISVFRPSTGTWYRQNSTNGSFVAFQFGATGDKPTVGDFDGDGKSDIAVFRPSTGAWYQSWSSNGFLFGEQFGVSTDKITQADYDGDGKTDIAIYRPSDGLWYVKRSATATYVPYVFGLAADIPTPGDFDGDGKADIGVFRASDGTWYIVNSTNGSYTIQQFGQSGDRPTESAFSD